MLGPVILALSVIPILSFILFYFVFLKQGPIMHYELALNSLCSQRWF